MLQNLMGRKRLRKIRITILLKLSKFQTTNEIILHVADIFPILPRFSSDAFGFLIPKE